MRALVLYLTPLMVGCFPAAPAYDPASATAPAAASTPANDEAQWQALEAQVAERASALGEPAEPRRVTGTAPAIEMPLQMSGGRCYAVVGAWSGEREMRASLRLVPNADGTFANDHLGGTQEAWAQSPGEMAFCADRDGAANLSLMAIGADGALVSSGRLELAVAIASHAETADEASARRASDAPRASSARAQIETNLWHADHRRGGEAFANGCARCRRKVYDCADDSSDGRAACASAFETCAQALGMDDRGRVLCAAP